MKQLMYIEVNVNKYNPLRASSYIQLPRQIQCKKAIVNINNNDQFCFGWAVTSAILTPNGPSDETSSYPDCRRFLQFRDIQFPVRLRDISKFEKYNPQISVNVYGLEKIFKDNVTKYEVVGPLYYSLHRNRRLHVNLLLITNEEGNSHYCCINDLSRLVSQQITSRDGKKHFCDGCLHYFRTAEQLEVHQRFDCNQVYTKLPTTDRNLDRWGELRAQNILKFDNYQKQVKVPFVIYADFETLLKPLDTGNQEQNPNIPFTVTTCEHVPYSFAYYLKCSFDDNLSKFEIYRGEDAVDVFIQRVDADVQTLYDEHLKHVVPMKDMVPEEIQNFNDAVSCHICERPFTNDDVKVRDHDHLSGDYRGAAHSNCNLNFNVPNFVPVFFHNLNYDSHLFVKQLAQDNEDIDVIPVTKEKYISFGKRLLVDRITEDGASKNVYVNIRFLDSYRFLSSSLASLAETLSDDQCVEIQNQFGNGIKFEQMRQKGVFPYSYTESFQKLDEPALPTIEQFYDRLSESHIPQADYDRAVKVWQTFGCKTLGDYSDVYLKCDVFILADVFENFRNLCLKQYKLDPAQYYTAPGLFWDAMLKFTGVELELLTDMNMLHFFRKGIRGGVSTCVGRKAIANNQFAGNYDPSKPTSFIMYLDATNLYGYAMQQCLPQRDFVWLTDEEIDLFNVFDVEDDSDTGYVLEVDLQYPEHLHDAHNDFPFCPELMVPPRGKFKNSKLIPNLCDKTKYLIHYRNLKQCLRAGLILTKTHRVLKFTQSSWLKPWIDLNTKLRNESENDFHRGQYKLANNAVYGKTMENVDKRVIVKLLSHWEKIRNRMGAEAYIAKANFKDRVCFSENLIAVEMNRTSVVYNKPSYVGFSVLDISKTVMYDFYYGFLKQQYDTDVSLLYTDTDSFILEINTENFYADMKRHLHLFDTSNYKNNPHGVPRTESVVGKFKDEYAGVAIRSFYGVGAKTYCVNAVGRTDKKAKGVKQHAVRKYLTSQIYQSVAENRQAAVFCQMYVFRSRLHTMYTELMNKVALSSNDDKRYLIPHTTKTLAWGHCDIPEHNLNEFVELLQAAETKI